MAEAAFQKPHYQKTYDTNTTHPSWRIFSSFHPSAARFNKTHESRPHLVHISASITQPPPSRITPRRPTSCCSKTPQGFAEKATAVASIHNRATVAEKDTAQRSDITNFTRPRTRPYHCHRLFVPYCPIHSYRTSRCSAPYHMTPTQCQSCGGVSPIPVHKRIRNH